jgi:hypothetical protein
VNFSAPTDVKKASISARIALNTTSCSGTS